MWNGTRSDLERQAGEHEDDTEQRTVGQPAIERGADAGEAGRAGEAIGQAHGEQQDAAGERAEHEVLEASLGRTLVRPQEGGEDVGRKTVHLEPM
jgi:hypothetical protein